MSETEIQLQWGDLRKVKPNVRLSNGKRSDGLHLSDVLAHIYGKIHASSSKHPKYGTVEDEEECPLNVAVGMAWEEWAAGAVESLGLYSMLMWQPGEVVCDGVACNCDGVCIDVESVQRLWECKATLKKRRPAKELVEREWRWVHQIGGYLHAYSNDRFDPILEADLSVLHLAGNYAGSGMLWVTYRMRYTEVEVSKIWQMVVREAAVLTEEKKRAESAKALSLRGRLQQ